MPSNSGIDWRLFSILGLAVFDAILMSLPLAFLELGSILKIDK